MNELDCLLAGVGGQGTVLASRLIAQAAMAKGLFARTAETIGMAQRGGCVVSHVRVGERARNGSPLIPLGRAEVILGGTAYDGGAMVEYLRGLPVKLILVDGEAVCRACGSSKVLNVALLGAAAASGALGLTLEEMEATVAAGVPERYLEMNRKALALGGASAG